MTHDYGASARPCSRRSTCSMARSSALHEAPPPPGVHSFPQPDRPPNPALSGHSPDHRQLRHPQDAGGQTVAEKTPALPHPFHPDRPWLNMVERFFAEITRKRIRRGVFKSVAELEQAIYDYLAIHNHKAVWLRRTATATAILEKTARPSGTRNRQGCEPSVKTNTRVVRRSLKRATTVEIGESLARRDSGVRPRRNQRTGSPRFGPRSRSRRYVAGSANQGRSEPRVVQARLLLIGAIGPPSTMAVRCSASPGGARDTSAPG